MLGTWIYQTTTTTGTGNLTLASVSGYPEFSTQFSSGQRFQYQILDDSTGAPIESGIGYLSSGALVRERIECTMVSGTFDNTTPTAVSLAAGTKRVICSVSAASVSSSAVGTYNAGAKGFGDSTMVFGAGGTYNVTSGRGYAFPFSLVSAQEIDAVFCRVTQTGAAGTVFRGAIYSIGADGLPDVQLALGATVAVDTTGQKFSTFTAFRPPQRFFAAVISDGAPGFFSTTVGRADSSLGFLTDHSPVGTVFKNGGGGTTFPTSWASPTGIEVVYSHRPIVVVRCT